MAVICWIGQDGSLGRVDTDGPWPPGVPSPAPEGATVIAELQWNQRWADIADAAAFPVGDVNNANPFNGADVPPAVVLPDEPVATPEEAG